ncbi:MAG TPA: HlyD family efflux transporter periplasmic adaptor subunit [Bacteroidales bacterium]|nr:HlyD family efflux transporter periplasmic adaptor subunit [Bacteroidales bacterium]
MKKSLIITGVIVVVSLVALGIFVRLTDKNTDIQYVEAEKGFFQISIDAAGELVAANSVDIKGPNIVGNRNFRASPIRIVDMVPEGTMVQHGDFVAELDRSAFVNSLKEEQDDLRTEQTNYDSKVLDTAVVLSQLRDEIHNQVFVVAEAEVTLAQSKFEPPATQRQAEITLDKARRTLEQNQKQYNLKRAQVKMELLNLKSKVNQQQNVVNDISGVLSAFTVRAPAAGMIIYKKDRMGQKIKAGTNLNPWDPVVATLPDMSVMLSKVYISEIDINKVTTGLPVEITIDAFPEKSYRGTVSSIANIGEQLPNSDSKVFEVLTKIDQYDPLLRPSMTTGNKVIVKNFNDVTFVPNESVHAGSDSVPFVYTRDRKKQIVVLGESNDKYIIVEEGLKPGTQVWLTVPENPEKFNLAGQELIPAIKEKERKLAMLDK